MHLASLGAESTIPHGEGWSVCTVVGCDGSEERRRKGRSKPPRPPDDDDDDDSSVSSNADSSVGSDDDDDDNNSPPPPSSSSYFTYDLVSDDGEMYIGVEGGEVRSRNGWNGVGGQGQTDGRRTDLNRDTRHWGNDRHGSNNDNDSDDGSIASGSVVGGSTATTAAAAATAAATTTATTSPTATATKTTTTTTATATATTQQQKRKKRKRKGKKSMQEPDKTTTRIKTTMEAGSEGDRGEGGAGRHHQGNQSDGAIVLKRQWSALTSNNGGKNCGGGSGVALSGASRLRTIELRGGGGGEEGEEEEEEGDHGDSESVDLSLSSAAAPDGSTDAAAPVHLDGNTGTVSGLLPSSFLAELGKIAVKGPRLVVEFSLKGSGGGGVVPEELAARGIGGIF